MVESTLEESTSRKDENIDEQENKYLTFPLHDSLYGIEIRHVLEVVIRSTTSKITQVPHMPDYTKGIINLRGKVIPVIDLRSRFSLPTVEYNDRTCYVIVDIGGVTTGLIVDTVAGVVGILTSNIDPPPELDESTESQFILGMGKTEDEVYVLLDIQKLLRQEELEELHNMGA